MRAVVVSAMIAVVAGCAGGDPAAEAGAEAGGEEAEEFVDAHRERFASYEVAVTELPEFTGYTVKVGSERPIVIRHSWFALELVLGRRETLAGSALHRTASRYSLRTGDSTVQAESVFALEDLATAGLQRRVQVCHDAQTGEVFLYEDHSWSVRRFILMHPAPGGTKVSYVHLPLLRTELRSGEFRILGIRDGKLYVEQDRVIYGYPLPELIEVEELAYGIG
jgi:hypothetical protein